LVRVWVIGGKFEERGRRVDLGEAGGVWIKPGSLRYATQRAQTARRRKAGSLRSG